MHLVFPARGGALVAGALLLLAACSSSPAATAPPAAPAASGAQSAPAPAAPLAVTQDPALPVSGQVAPAALSFTLAPDGAEARYRAREVLAGQTLPSDAIGRTRVVSGSIRTDATGAILADTSRLVVDLTTLRSDSGIRDNFVRTNTLQVDRYPRAEFIPRVARGLPTALPSSGDVTFQLDGDLTVHDVTRPVTWTAVVHFGDPEVTGTATTRVNITDFGMELPRVARVVSLEDAINLEIDFRFVPTS